MPQTNRACAEAPWHNKCRWMHFCCCWLCKICRNQHWSEVAARRRQVCHTRYRRRWMEWQRNQSWKAEAAALRDLLAGHPPTNTCGKWYAKDACMRVVHACMECVCAFKSAMIVAVLETMVAAKAARNGASDAFMEAQYASDIFIAMDEGATDPAPTQQGLDERAGGVVLVPEQEF